MKILITGGAGFIGTNIVIEAINEGHEVIVWDDLSRKGSDKNAKFLKEKYHIPLIQMDIRAKIGWDTMEKTDAVIHLAANPGIPKSLEDPLFDFTTNALGTLYALEYARKCNIPFLYASTNKVYSDGVNEIPMLEKETRYEYRDIKGINELFPLYENWHPHSPYGVSKLTGDILCQEYYHAFNVSTIVFRMSCIYGLHQNGVEEQGWISHFVKTIRDGDGKINIYGTGKQVRDMLFGTDCAKAYLLALNNIDKMCGQAYNLGGGEYNVSLLESIKIIEDMVGKKAELSFKPKRHADHDIYISDITKIKKYLGWEPGISVEEGIKQMVEEKYDYCG